MRHGEHHLHRRHRIHVQHQQYPNPDPKIRALDNVCMAFSVIMPATTIPQIWKTYYYQDATGLSLLMWVLYCVAVIPWLIYGIVHKSKPIIVLNVLWIIVQLIMVAGIMIYG